MSDLINTRTKTGFLARPRPRIFLLVLLIVLGGVGITAAIRFHRFYNHVTVQEVSHAVTRSTFQTSIRDGKPVTLQIYKPANPTPQPLVFFSSGDGGWSPFCADIAAHLAATGRTVVGFDSKGYLTSFASPEHPVTPENLVTDYETMVAASLKHTGADANSSVELSGWSLGAGFSVLVASKSELRSHIGRIVAVSLPVLNEMAWKPTDSIIYLTHGTPNEKAFDAHDYLASLGSVPVVMLNASGDSTAPIKEAQSLYGKISGPKELFTVNAWGHHFEGGEKDFYEDLDKAFEMKF